MNTLKNEKDQSLSLPPKIVHAYHKFQRLPETMSHQLFEAQSRHSNERHIIRIIDNEKPLLGKPYYETANLFLREALSLQLQNPKVCLVNRFEISKNGNQMAYAMRFPIQNLKHTIFTPKEKSEIQFHSENPKTPRLPKPFFGRLWPKKLFTPQ